MNWYIRMKPTRRSGFTDVSTPSSAGVSYELKVFIIVVLTYLMFGAIHGWSLAAPGVDVNAISTPLTA
ncbi:hypothetical protein D9M70_454040 [compost metagenome]